MSGVTFPSRATRLAGTRRPDLTGHAMTEATPDLLPLVSRLAEISQIKGDLEQEEKTLKAQLRERIKVGDKVTVHGNPVLAVQPYRRFSPQLAQQNLTPELLELCTVSTVDSKRAKEVLPPALYSTCMQDFEPRVVLL